YDTAIQDTSSSTGWYKYASTSVYGGTATATQESRRKATFLFTGTGVRIIGHPHSNRSTNIKITIDGVTEVFSQKVANGTANTIYQVLSYEKVGLDDMLHFVEIESGTDELIKL